MSTEAVESVLSRAMSDAAFANTLFANVELALTGFDLTGEEVEKFKGLARADFDTLMASPEERKSFSKASPGDFHFTHIYDKASP
jgi:hypothetical protein